MTAIASKITLSAVLAALLLVSVSAAQAQDKANGALVEPSVSSQIWEGGGTSLAWWANVVGGFPEPIRTK